MVLALQGAVVLRFLHPRSWELGQVLVDIPCRWRRPSRWQGGVIVVRTTGTVLSPSATGSALKLPRD